MIVGLTGGIGSGKSTVGRLFRLWDVPVYIADIEAKILLDSDEDLQEELVNLLGNEIRSKEGINRALLAQKIFADKALRQKVNAIIHPAVARDFAKWHKAHPAPYVLREAAILYESGSHRDCHKVIVVHAANELRIARVMQRSKMSREEVQQRMASQWPQSEKMNRADYLIANEEKIPDIDQLEQHWRTQGKLPDTLSKPAIALMTQVKSIHENIIRIANPGG